MEEEERRQGSEGCGEDSLTKTHPKHWTLTNPQSHLPESLSGNPVEGNVTVEVHALELYHPR